MAIELRLTPTEYAGYCYLRRYNIQIDSRKIHLLRTPDFVSKCENRYEIKRIISSFSDKKKNPFYYIWFTKKQITNFKDDDVILMFYPFEKEPSHIVKFGDIKHKITKSGNLAISFLKKIKGFTLKIEF